MGTTLLLYAANAAEAPIRRAVPPQFWPGHLHRLMWADGHCTVDLGALTDAREVLPCLSARSPAPWGYQCALEYETATGHSGRTALDPVGAFAAAETNGGTKAVASVTDLLLIREPLQRAVLHLRAQGIHARDSALLSISIRDHGAAPAPAATGPGADIAVPARSQMVLRADLASHVCSPTSVAMLLDYYGHSTDIYELIAEARHQPSGLYGVWPANVHAATRRGLMGYLLHFPGWDAARALLDAGMPIVASVRYEEGDLRDAAIPQTNGHLLVLRGYDGDKVMVNDPAAKAEAEVARTYDLKEFCRVWLGNSAVGYVLFEEGV